MEIKDLIPGKEYITPLGNTLNYVGVNHTVENIVVFSDSNGELYNFKFETALKLHEKKEEFNVDFWFNIYPGGQSAKGHKERSLADTGAAPDRIACVKVTVKYHEGEGL